MNKIRKNIFGFLFSGFALNACLLSFGMNRHEIVKKLYNSKIEYNKNDFEINIFNNGWGLLYYAINNNNLNMFKFFLECGATIDYAGSEQAKSNEKNNQFDAKKYWSYLIL